MGVLNFYFLIGAIMACAFGRYWGSKIALLTNIALLAGSFVWTTILLYEAIRGSISEVII